MTRYAVTAKLGDVHMRHTFDSMFEAEGWEKHLQARNWFTCTSIETSAREDDPDHLLLLMSLEALYLAPSLGEAQ